MKLEIWLTRAQMLLLVLGAVLLGGLAALAATTADRSQTGYPMVETLNGSFVFKAHLEDDAGVGCNYATVDDGMNTSVQCDNDVYMGNSTCDGGTQAAFFHKVTAGTEYNMGFLRRGAPYVAVETLASVNAKCTVFQGK